MTLTKADLVKRLIEGGNSFTPAEAKRLVEILLELVKRTLAGGEDILISGFGKFCVKEKRPRKGRSPTSGADIELQARRIVTFKCSPVFRDRIR